MNAVARESLAGWLVAALWAAAPLYPSFVSLMPIAPPGLSIVPRPVSLTLLGLVCAAIVALFGLLIADGGGRLLRHPLLQAVWIYAAAGAIIGMLGFAPLVGVLYAVFVGSTGIGVAAMFHWMDVPRFARRIRVAMLGSSAFAALLALGLWIAREPAALYAVGNGRAIGCFVVPGELAGYFGMFIPFAVAVGLSATTMRDRFWAYGIALLQVAALSASLSRAGIGGIVVGAGIVLAHRQRRWFWMYAGVLAVLAVSLGGHLFDAHHNPAEDTNRLAIWYAAVRVIELFPLIGVGPGGFAHIYPLVRLPGGETAAWHAHNFVLATLAETGFIGFAALANLWVRFAFLVRNSFAGAPASGQQFALVLLAGFAGTWLQSSIDVVQILILGLWIPFMGLTLIALRPINAPDRAPLPSVRGEVRVAKRRRRRALSFALVGSMALTLGACSQEHAQNAAAPTPSPPAVSVSSNAATPMSTRASAAPLPSASGIPPFVIHARRQGRTPVSIMVTQGARRLYTIDADSNETERTQSGAYHSSFAQPKLIFFNRDGSKMRATAIKAEVDGTSKVVTMLGNVHLYAQDGTTLTCERLQYDDRNSHVEGFTAVVVTTKQGDVLHGQHFAGDVHLQHIHIDGTDSAP